MGVTFSVYAVSHSDLDRMLQHPPLIHQLVGCEQGSRAAAELPRNEEYLDKAWGGILFVLIGTDCPDEDVPEPLAFLALGGTNIGDIDVGYGPARAFRRADVAEIARKLRPIDVESFAARIDHAALLAARVYGIGGDEAADRDYLISHYEALRDLVLAADARGDALVVA